MPDVSDALSRAIELNDQGKCREAFRILLTAARQGDDEVFLTLGNAYADGQGVRRSEESALRWYRRALRTSHSQAAAANNIGVLYRDRGNLRRAFFWWNRAAQQGDGDALVTVGYCLQYGLGVRKDVRSSMRSYRAAIASSYISAYDREEAQYHLALACLDESTSARSVRRAKELLSEAAADGDYPEASAVLRQLELGRPLKPCRCRRDLDRDLRFAHISCLCHPGESASRRRLAPSQQKRTRAEGLR